MGPVLAFGQFTLLAHHAFMGAAHCVGGADAWNRGKSIVAASIAAKEKLCDCDSWLHFIVDLRNVDPAETRAPFVPSPTDEYCTYIRC
jgi:hypothetical protein